MNAPRVASVVVHWERPKTTLECVASLRDAAYPEHEVLVVDNRGDAELRDGLRSVHPDATLLTPGRNLGFAGGNNLAFEEALRRGAAFVFLLNPDAVVERGAIGRLVRAIEGDESLGVVGPLVVSFERPERVLYAGGTIDWRRAESFIRRPRPSDEGRLVEVDWVPGCALLARVEALRRVGPMDPKYFLYFEETDWCARANRAGFRVALLGERLARHRERESGVHTKSAPFHYYFCRNHPRFALRHAPRRSLPAFFARWAWRTLVFRGALYYALGWLKGRDPADLRAARARAAAFLDFVRGRFGEGPVWLDAR